MEDLPTAAPQRTRPRRCHRVLVLLTLAFALLGATSASASQAPLFPDLPSSSALGSARPSAPSSALATPRSNARDASPAPCRRPVKVTSYDPCIRLFLQLDPSGYADSPNLYAGFANDPINHKDPTGTEYQGPPENGPSTSPGLSEEEFRADAGCTVGACFHEENISPLFCAQAIAGTAVLAAAPLLVPLIPGAPEYLMAALPLALVGKSNADPELAALVLCGAIIEEQVQATVIQKTPTPALEKGVRVERLVNQETARVAKAVTRVQNVGYPAKVAVPASRLGIPLNHVEIEGGVAHVEISTTLSISRRDIRPVLDHLKAQGATSAVVDTGYVVNAELRSSILARAKAGKPLLGDGRIQVLDERQGLFRIFFDKL